ncbi:putative Dormancy/auxin associated family protein [Tripterygium wilfordii]|uniref:Putative Dormancy/auxin associated family protein n=1 Tax=Tripterygium wilfordii TaxID=458696 RepID=A0A7J7CDT8_TRIWF|nr:dormancy-associated protein homolog 4 isoform X2 [Tripterygium wilfordii]KAF5732095.1 putative Dormancy/auxin associated family protein [Tripterygium wilfordii]
MGFLHKLWDETLAGPAPETGLGKLRKYDSFTTSTNTRSSPTSHRHDNNHIAVTRSISIIRSTTSNLSVDPGSPPDSPAGSTTPATPGTPLSPGTPRTDFKRLMRRKSSAEALESAESRRL